MGPCRNVLLILAILSVSRGIDVQNMHTKLGDIVGVVEQVRNEKVYQFRNIPYAKPPVGSRRFTKPELSGPWAGTLNATQFGPSCIQPMLPPPYNKYLPNLNQSEDCLILNIYVPRDISPNTRKSVMLWIHGGDYVLGQGMYYDGSYLALTGDVVVVTINYRLGLFGFLSTPHTGELNGNYGLWDQHLALQWVKDNIDDYGGDSNSVTIFGESAGGFCVSLQAIVPQNQGLFQRVISQSGSALSSYSYVSSSNMHTTAKLLGIKLGCANTSGIPTSYAECMRGKSTDDLLAAQNIVTTPTVSPLNIDEMIGPVIDNDFLHSSPEEIMKDRTSAGFQFFKNLDFMTGNVNAEGSVFFNILTMISKYKKFDLNVGVPSDVFCSYIVPVLLSSYFSSQINSTLPSDLICSLYGTSSRGHVDNNVIGVFSDVFFIVPAIKALIAHSDDNARASTYQYIFKRKALDMSFLDYPTWWRNDFSAHGSELFFLFNIEDFPSKFNMSVGLDDISFSKSMQKYWTNFAKTGNPNSNDVPMWSGYDAVNQSYIDLDAKITSGQHLYGDSTSLCMEPGRLALLLLTIISTTQGIEVQHIHTKLGGIVGVVEQIRNEKVYQFRNVPYAKPPVGELRFAKPESRGPWTGILNATQYGPSCMQSMQPAFQKNLPNLIQSEDCLILNIYVPRDVTSNSSKSVMVWIHGGGYVFGQGMFYDGSYLALTGDVVVVTINYRLGLFGFLSTPYTGELHGNYGLWDQRLALQWVKDNIDDYGGDPNSVTIFGESAGGFSVSLQAIMPHNQGLFQRVIAQSGIALSTLTYIGASTMHSTAKRLGIQVGCANTSGIPLTYTRCMREKSAGDLLAAQNILLIPTLPPLTIDGVFGPVIDNDFLHYSPAEVLTNRTSPGFQFFQNLDFMTGNVNAEGSVLLNILTLMSKYKKFDLNVGVPTDVFCNYIVPVFVSSYFGSQVNSTLPSDLVCSFYRSSSESPGYNAIDAFSDAFFLTPAIKALMAHAEGNTRTSTYQYIFKRPSPDPLLRIYLPWWRNDSSVHASEISFLFGLEDFQTKFNTTVSPNDVILSKTMLKYWTNFAKTGDPNSNDVPVWSGYDAVQQGYVDLNTTITLGQHLYRDSTSLWLQRLPKLVHIQEPGGVIGK
ncbi:acetylcholinesterase-like [Ylistrum balloti]|uniref:acetylcholinesterase-like n=1 Tax=Ylistrum balloti TaxID=509963 RepID=UPI0029059C18|nr:acetylcholinesterase-like [Ylistrum balloti]